MRLFVRSINFVVFSFLVIFSLNGCAVDSSSSTGIPLAGSKDVDSSEVVMGGSSNAELDVMKPAIGRGKIDEWLSKIKIEHDEFKKQTNYEGGSLVDAKVEYAPFYQNDYYGAFLFAVKEDSSQEVFFQIYISSNYNKSMSQPFRSYDAAQDSDGKVLPLMNIHRGVESCNDGVCSVFENIAINIDRAYLKQREKNGMRFKISGYAGERVVVIPSEYIEAFLSVVI